MTMPGFSSRFRRRLMAPGFEDEMQPQMGPDIQATSGWQGPQFMQPPPMQQPQNSSLGQSLGTLAGVGFNRLRQTMAPNLKSANPMHTATAAQSADITAGLQKSLPDVFKPGGPTPSLNAGGGGPFGRLKKVFGFREGTKDLRPYLRRPDDEVVVGEDGPEMLRKKPGGGIEVIPARLGQSMNGQGARSPAELAALGIPTDAQELPKVPVVEDGREVGYNTTDTPPQQFTRLRRALDERRSLPEADIREREVYPGPYSKIRALLGAATSPDNPVAQTANEYQPATPGQQPTQPVPVLPEYDETQSQSRPKFADMPGRWRSQREYEQANPAQPPTGRSKWQKIVDVLGQGAASVNAARAINPNASGLELLAAGGTGAAVQGFRPQTIYEGRQRQRIGEYGQREADALKLEGAQADVRYKNAQAGYAEARPDLEAAKRLDAQAKAAQSAVLANLRLLKGTRLDPNNARHVRLLERAADAGIYVDPDEWNDAKDNLVPVEVIDPQNPTATRKMLLNKVTGETSDYGQGRYVQPVDQKTGMTPYQTGSLALGGARFGETRRHNQVTEAQGSERIGISRQNLNLSAERNLISWKSYESRQDNIDFREKRTHYTEARKLIEKHNQHTASANRYAGYKGEDDKQPQWARLKQEEQEALADSVQNELATVYGDVYQPGSGTGLSAPPAPTAVAPSSGSSQPSAVKGRVSRANFGKFREQNPQYTHMDDAQVEQLLRSQGVEVY